MSVNVELKLKFVKVKFGCLGYWAPGRNAMRSEVSPHQKDDADVDDD